MRGVESGKLPQSSPLGKGCPEGVPLGRVLQARWVLF